MWKVWREPGFRPRVAYLLTLKVPGKKALRNPLEIANEDFFEMRILWKSDNGSRMLASRFSALCILGQTIPKIYISICSIHGVGLGWYAHRYLGAQRTTSDHTVTKSNLVQAYVSMGPSLLPIKRVLLKILTKLHIFVKISVLFFNVKKASPIMIIQM